jgi:hypothetical protein
MPHEHRAVELLKSCARIASFGLLVFSAACPGNFVKSDRATPLCATRNCDTGEVIDDGCSADGKCLSCSNDCGGKVAPRNGPKQ